MPDVEFPESTDELGSDSDPREDFVVDSDAPEVVSDDSDEDGSITGKPRDSTPFRSYGEHLFGEAKDPLDVGRRVEDTTIRPRGSTPFRLYGEHLFREARYALSQGVQEVQVGGDQPGAGLTNSTSGSERGLSPKGFFPAASTIFALPSADTPVLH